MLGFKWGKRDSSPPKTSNNTVDDYVTPEWDIESTTSSNADPSKTIKTTNDKNDAKQGQTQKQNQTDPARKSRRISRRFALMCLLLSIVAAILLSERILPYLPTAATGETDALHYLDTVMLSPHFWTYIWSVLGGVLVLVLVYRLRHRLRFGRLKRCCSRLWTCYCSKSTSFSQSSETSPSSPFGTDASTIRSLTIPYLCSSRRPQLLIAVLLIALLASSALSVVSSYASKALYNALDQRDAIGFRRAMVEYALVILAYAPIEAAYTWRVGVTAVEWREWLTRMTLGFWGKGRVYYRLERRVGEKTDDGTGIMKGPAGTGSSEGTIDNPDQRIAEDIKSFTTIFLKLFVHVLRNLVSLVSFSIVLYAIAPELFIVIVLYSVCGTVVAIGLGLPLTKSNAESLKREADLRFHLVRTREDAESIAFYHSCPSTSSNSSRTKKIGDVDFYDGSTPVEFRTIASRLSSAVSIRLRILLLQLRLESFTHFYFYASWIVPLAIVAPRYLRGEIALGEVMQAREAFYRVTSDLSTAVREMETCTEFLAGVGRLREFFRAMEEVAENKDGLQHGGGDDGNKGNRESEYVSKGLQEVGLKRIDSENTMISASMEPIPSDSVTTVDDTLHTSNISSQRAEQTPPLLSRILILPPPRTTITSISTSPPHVTASPIVLRLNSFTISVPRRVNDNDSYRSTTRTLINDLNLTLHEGDYLLVTGRSGVGKSSLLRGIAGLWTNGSGTVERPSQDECLFLPQNPYCPIGTLRDLILYPSFQDDHGGEDRSHSGRNQRQFKSSANKPSDDELLAILSLVQLPRLAAQIGNGDPYAGLSTHSLDWSRTLSLGERQRLAFARVFIKCPRLLVMDEATSALDLWTEERIFSLLRRMGAASSRIARSGSADGIIRIPIEVCEGGGGGDTGGARRSGSVGGIGMRSPIDDREKGIGGARRYNSFNGLGATQGSGRARRRSGGSGGGLKSPSEDWEKESGDGRRHGSASAICSGGGGANGCASGDASGGVRVAGIVPFRPIEGGMTYVSVGHRSSLTAFHDKKLVLRGEDDGVGGCGYQLNEIEGAQTRLPSTSNLTNLY